MFDNEIFKLYEVSENKLFLKQPLNDAGGIERL
jgi:hypothetical protein